MTKTQREELRRLLEADEQGQNPDSEVDLAFRFAARSRAWKALPKLLDALDEAEQEVERLREELDDSWQVANALATGKPWWKGMPEDIEPQEVRQCWHGRHDFEEMEPNERWRHPWQRCKHCGFGVRSEILANKETGP